MIKFSRPNFLRVPRFVSRKIVKKNYKKTTAFIARRPFVSFFGALIVLLLLIILSSFLSPKAKEVQPSNTPVQVQLYNIGKAPEITVSAKIEKSGVIKITALTSGVVQSIDANEGDSVNAGQTLIELSTNYQGGNAPALQSDLATDQLQNFNDTYQEQKDLIGTQRDLANNQNTQSSDLRNIQNNSISQTQSLIDLDNQILSSIQSNIQTLQQSNPNDPQILQDQELESQYQSAVNSLNSSLQNTQYQVSPTSGAPINIANDQQQITLKQLDIQQKSLDLTKETDGLQSAIAAVNAAQMTPASPINGTVERIYVRLGQAVTPGTVLAEISGSSNTTTAVASVPQGVAERIENIEPSTLTFDTKKYSEMPLFVPKEATNNELFEITYTVPDEFAGSVTDGQYIPISIPVGTINTSAADPFVPIDAIFQTQTDSYLYVDKNGAAYAKKVELGEVFGSYVEVQNGLQPGDRVILSRNIIAGDKVQAE